MRTHEHAKLGPVALAVFAVWLAANLAAGVDGIEQRLTHAVEVIQRIHRVASRVIERATEGDRAAPADGDDGDDAHTCR